jgi:diguanylate cyclase (GGDEF)-like protein/PAS domain S-box-containing protein
MVISSFVGPWRALSANVRARRKTTAAPDVPSNECGESASASAGLPKPVHRSAWKWFLAFEGLMALIYFPFGIPSGRPRILGFVPWMEWPGQVPAWAILGLSAVGAIAYGTHRYRPRGRLAWWFMGAGVLLFISGDTIYKSWHQLIGNQNIPFPSFIDAIYITMYPVLAIGLLLLTRSRVRGSDRASLLDALIVTLGVALVSWIFLIGPTVRAPGDLLVRLTAAAYPLGDILLLAMLAHLWSAGSLKNVAGRLLALGTVGTLLADSVYGLAGLHTAWNWSDGNPFDLGWILFYACWGAAALHPSMAKLSEPAPVTEHRTSRARLVMLAGVSLIGPVVLIAEAANGHSVDAPVVAAVAALMFLLVLVRMSGLVTVHQQAVARERVLRRAASELVAAPGRLDIYEATITAIGELVSGLDKVLDITVAVRDETGSLSIVARARPGAGSELVDLDSYSAEVRERLVAGTALSCPAEAGSTEGHSSGEYLLLLPLVDEDRLKALITVRTSSELEVDLTGTLETLGAQVRLALDREEMTESFHVRRSESRFQTLVRHASDVILITRPDTTITYQTPSAERILGYVPGSLEGVRLTTLLHPDDIENAVARYGGAAFGAEISSVASWRIRHRDGSWRDVEVLTNNLLSDPTVEGIVLTMRDVSERKGLEDELKHQAFHDALSGLANRALFTDRLEHGLARAARLKSSLAVLFLDLDDFKLVNDSLGHAAGDELLVAVAQRLTGSLRVGDTAARFGGDEFAILLEEVSSSDEAQQVAERVIEDLSVPLVLGEREVWVHASIGIALSHEGAENPSELLQAADVAMYAAKSAGKNRHELYHPALQAAISVRLERTAQLQRAVDARQFVVHYQPIIDLELGEVVGVEALVRWQHPDHGLLPPDEFISLAEETGLIVPIGRFVLEEACIQAARWQQEHENARRLKVNVNISVRHFQDEGLMEDVRAALHRSGLDPSYLVLEITESLLLHEVESVIARMLELKRLGISFAVDDFGTGYSSLSYLKRFPIDILKVDKAFVDNIGNSSKDSALATAIVQLGRSLELDTVAEGIEQNRQVDGLIALGCRYGQGFLFAHPLSATDLDEMLPLIASERLGQVFSTLTSEGI